MSTTQPYYDDLFKPAEYTVLIVDDHPENLRILDSYLKEHGFQTLIATKGELALKRVQYSSPDLILLDVLLPDIDGFETCRLLKDDDQTKNIPVIFMTALTETTHKLQGFHVGGVDYITKPFQYDEILARITAHLRIRGLTRHLQSQATILSKRATQLEAGSQIAQQMNSILDPVELLTTVVSLIQSQFGYYMVSLWLLEQQNTLVLQACHGVHAQTLPSSGLTLTGDPAQSLIATACQSGDYGLRNQIIPQTPDVLLAQCPETKSELAIPLKQAQEVIGVLDIRHDRAAAFDQEDIAVLQILANQISIALRNARLYRELEVSNTKLEEMSVTDPLTGLRNRRYLTRFIQHDLAKVHRELNRRKEHGTDASSPNLNIDIGFLLVDIDHFKSVNDTYGHDAGDLVLQQFRDILNQCCRQTDIPIRWGGEEFLIEARFSERAALHIIAERIRHAVQEHPFAIGEGQNLRLTCSIGFASYPFLSANPDAVNWEQVVSIADRCLYVAKMSGRNAWVGMTSTTYTNADNVFQRIQQSLETLIVSGEIVLLSSIGQEPGSERSLCLKT